MSFPVVPVETEGSLKPFTSSEPISVESVSFNVDQGKTSYIPPASTEHEKFWMPTEYEAVRDLTENEFRWYQLWMNQLTALDQKAGVIVTLDGILLALSASFLGTTLVFGVSAPSRTVLGISTILVLSSAIACTRVIWVRFYGSKILADMGSLERAYSNLLDSRTTKTRNLHRAIITLLAALSSYAITILLLLAQY